MTTYKVFGYVGNPMTTTNGKPTESVNAYQHRKALDGHTNEFGRALRKMLEGWEAYANASQERYECTIGEDHVMGEYWANVGFAIKRLLDGDVGGFDCGSLAANITGAIEAQGFKTDGYSLQSEGSDQ